MKKVFLLSFLSVGLVGGFMDSIHAMKGQGSKSTKQKKSQSSWPQNWENTPLNSYLVHMQAGINKIPHSGVKSTVRIGHGLLSALTVFVPVLTTYAVGDFTKTMKDPGKFRNDTSTSAKCALTTWELGVFAAWMYGLVNGTRWLSKKVRGKKSDDDQEPAGDGTENSEPVLENKENSAAVLEDVAQVDLVGEPE